MTELYPLLFDPVLKHYIWGGRNLKRFGRDLPDKQHVAEIWEIASHPDGMSVVSNGHFAGKTLPQLLALLGVDLVGKNNQWALDRGIFPIMVKLLDAEKRLSVQVHPDDAYAFKHEGNELGKAEMWVVLAADPGAAIIYGFSQKTTPDEFRHAIRMGSLEPFLNRLPIKAGDHICVPPGTLHAILEGAVLVEIQQNSNITYRVYDWNRTDDQGYTRPLHIEQALQVINFNQINPRLPQPKVIESSAQIKRERLCQNQYFTTERIAFHKKGELLGQCNGSSLEIWGALSGQARIADVVIAETRFCLLPASLGDFHVKADPDSVLIRVFTA